MFGKLHDYYSLHIIYNHHFIRMHFTPRPSYRYRHFKHTLKIITMNIENYKNIKVNTQINHVTLSF